MKTNIIEVEKSIKNLFSELGEDIVIDGIAVMNYIKDKIGELGIDGEGCEVEDVYIINNKKYVVFYNVDVKYKEAEDGRIEPKIIFNNVSLA